MDQSSTCVAFSHPPAESSPDEALPVTQPKMLAAGYGDGTVRVFDIDRVSAAALESPRQRSLCEPIGCHWKASMKYFVK